jgi:hypothetical protein
MLLAAGPGPAQRVATTVRLSVIPKINRCVVSSGRYVSTMQYQSTQQQPLAFTRSFYQEHQYVSAGTCHSESHSEGDQQIYVD